MLMSAPKLNKLWQSENHKIILSNSHKKNHIQIAHWCLVRIILNCCHFIINLNSNNQMISYISHFITAINPNGWCIIEFLPKLYLLQSTSTYKKKSWKIFAGYALFPYIELFAVYVSFASDISFNYMCWVIFFYKPYTNFPSQEKNSFIYFFLLLACKHVCFDMCKSKVNCLFVMSKVNRT
jgi:hypothetical protein